MSGTRPLFLACTNTSTAFSSIVLEAKTFMSTSNTTADPATLCGESNNSGKSSNASEFVSLQKYTIALSKLYISVSIPCDANT
ncbi:hypothetical protein PanWU01x14_238080 [Parasponia andersonii]|uniref:Uncharacterized protein n=1 Tax=Parasponia andersonii TaxID=3476 RepID=A0A2P5BHK5_PARAD|nr:hypothetical protein PanWU01x14_238080 [Parasponia andersonii]